MVRPAKLTLALLGVLVVLGHVLALEWLARQAELLTGLQLMTPPMYTRMLEPAAPPPVVAVAVAAPPAASPPKARVAPQPRPPASSAEELRREREAQEQARREAELEQQLAQAEAEDRARQEQAAEAAAAATSQAQATAAAASQAQATAAAAPEAQGAASGPGAPATAPATGTGPLDHWPVDTRLTYVLTGQYRGPLYGDARVQWQRQGGKYQVRLDASIQVFGTQVLTSQGEVTPDGLIPRAYEESRPGKRRTARMGDDVVTLENGHTVPRPPGVQDTASQFVELTQRFATGREVLEVGRSVTLWLARPGGVDQWVYEIVGREPLVTPKFGTVDSFHLKPRPIAKPRGNINVEMWIAPSLQYLPARIKIVMGEEAYLDLIVDHIEQR